MLSLWKNCWVENWNKIQLNLTEERSDYDSPWKEMLELFFEQFMAFYFPIAHAGIDWTRKHEFLDKELQKVVRDAESGRRYVDKLIKVFREDGEDIWVLVHVEVQGQVDQEFDKRMYRYHYRLYDRYDRQVISLAILTDDNENWRPGEFQYELWGCKSSLVFPVVKLLDYQKQWTRLEQEPNPFSIITMAHLKSMATQRNAENRFRAKFALIKMLYKRGYSRKYILELLRFIDWVMKLPHDLEEKLNDAVNKFEEEQKMKYKTYGERKAEQQGLQQGLLEGIAMGLKLKFGMDGEKEMIKIRNIQDPKILQAINWGIITANTLDELRNIYAERN
jgi:hypothetical protein